MSYFNIVAQTNENTVVTEYTPAGQRSGAYQSEAALEKEFIELLRQQGYSAEEFHYNSPSFYSRGVFSEAMGYQAYVCYADYLKDVSADKAKQLLYDDQLLFDNEGLNNEFFREGKRLNFIITRSAHLSYKYNEVLSYWGLKKYPEFKGLTGNEETDCAYLKAKLVLSLIHI